MSGFLEGHSGSGARGFLEQAPAAGEGIGGAINIPGLDDILASEGAQHVAPVMRAILSQESGGNPKVGNSVDGARGIGQIMPDTFKMFAKPGERIDNPADNLRVAARLLNDLHKRSGGDPAKMAAGYFSGAGNIGTNTPYKVDHKDGNGKSVSSYVSDVLGRMGAPAPEKATPEVKEPTAEKAAPARKWSEVVKRPVWNDMTPAERELLRAEYFNRHIAPGLADEEYEVAKADFMERSKGLDPREPGIGDKIAEGFKAVGDALTNLPDPLKEKWEREKREKEGAAGILAGSKSAIRFDDLPVTPEYLRAMKAKWNSATPAQRDELAARTDHLGVVARRLNEAYAGKKSTPTLDMIDPRAEARARRLIASGVHGDTADGLARESARRDMLPGTDLGTSRIEETEFDFEARKKYNEDPFFKHAAVRGAVKGYEHYKQGSLGLAQFAADHLGADEFAKTMATGAAESRGFTNAMGTPTDHLQRNFEGAISSIALQLPGMIGGAVTGSSALTLSAMFAQTFGMEYSDGRARGQDANEATKRASLFAAFEVIGERLGLKTQLALMRNAARGVETNVLAKFMANTLKNEIPGESITTTGQFLTDKLGGGIGLNTEAGIADYLQQMGDTLTQTVMQGGIMSGGIHGLNATAKGLNAAGGVAKDMLDPMTWGASRAEREIAAEIDRNAEGVKFTGIDSFVREQLDPNRTDVNPADTRKTPPQVWRRRPSTPDAHAAGLTPEQQAVDAEAEAAFADLLEDEIPVSTLRGVEAGDDAIGEPGRASSEEQKPASMRVSEGSDLEGDTRVADPVAGTAAPAAEAETDLFGDPIAREHAVSSVDPVQVPVASLSLSKDVPQFKSGANGKGVVDPLGGKFDQTGVAPIQVWEREDGRMEVISGRHRLDLAQRSGTEHIWAQVHREADGFTAQHAAVLDAELNIKDGQGKVKDYVEFFRNGVTREDAEARGLFRESGPGRKAHTIANDGSDALVAAHRADVVTDEGAYGIARTAPGDERLQAVGIKAIQDGKSIKDALNLIQAVKSMTQGGGQDSMDMFGFDDSAMREAEGMAKIASRKQREISDRVTAVSNAAKNPKLAKAEGVDVKDPDAVLKRVEELKGIKAKWDNWPTNPDLVAEIRAEMAPALELTAPTEGELREKAQQTEKAKAEERKAKADAEKAEKEAQDAKETKRRIDASVDEFQLGETGERAVSGQSDIFDSPKSPVYLEGTPEYDELRKREETNDKIIDAITHGQVMKAGAAIGITGQDPERIREKIKQQHPDDVEKAIRALDPPAPVTDEEKKAAQKMIADAPYIRLDRMASEVSLQYVSDIRDRVLLRRFEQGVPDRKGMELQMQFIVRDGKLWHVEDEWAATATPSSQLKLAPVSILQHPSLNEHRKPKNEREAKAIAAIKAAQEGERVDNGIPAGVPNGQYGNVDHPMRFMSGLSRKGDFNIFAKGAHIGVSVGELSNATLSGPQLGKAMTDANRYLFVDSGAYSFFQGVKRYNEKTAKGIAVDPAKLPKPLDFDEIMDTYRILHQEIAKADDSGFATERAFFVMPDIIGDQTESLKLIHEYGPWIADFGDNAIVPLQAGGLSLTEAYEVMMAYLNRNLTDDESPILGIPTSQMAASDAELTALLKTYGPNIRGIHILGGVSDSKLQPRLDAIRAAGYEGNVSADGAAWRGPLAVPGTSRADAVDIAIEKLYGKKDTKTDFDAMFDEIAEEEKPKTEKEAKAKKARTKKAKTKEVDPATIKISPDSLYQPHHQMFKRFAEFTVQTEHGPMQVSMSGATNPANYEAIYGEPGGIINVRTPVSPTQSNERAGLTYKGVLTQERAEEIARNLIAEVYDAGDTKPKTDFDAMFDEIAAEEKPRADKPQATPVHEMTRTEYRADEGSRGKSGGLKAASINMDNETVESLLKNHRSSIPFLGALMGAKGGKNVPKMAADIMRIWKLRDKLAKATVDGLIADNNAESLKALAKEVGIYSGLPKKSLAEGIIKWRDAQRSLATERLQDAKHFKAVRAALEQGQPVRADVVKDYPDLAAQYFGRETPEYKRGIHTLALNARTSEIGDAAPQIAKLYREDAAKATGKEAEIANDIAEAIEKSIKAENQPVSERSIAEAAASAAKNTGKGMKNAALGLAKLFGQENADSNIKNMNSGIPVKFNEETYRQAKPLFIEAVNDAENAVTDLKEVMRKLFIMVREMIGYDGAVNMKPYMTRFMEEYEEGTYNDEPATGNDTQQDRADHGNEASGRDHSVHGGPEAAGATGEQHGDQAGGQQDAGADAGVGVHDTGAPTRGEGRSDGVSEPNGELGVDRGNSQPNNGTGSGRTGANGTTADDGEADGVVSEADGARDVEIQRTWEETVAAQKAAEKIPVILGDKANIDATLPLLLPAQREDVLFAEKRLNQPKGFGVLFANGTGTGKTYLSLGIIKRMIRTGKKNGVVVVPNQEVMNEWLASAPNLGIELYQLGDKQDKGRGVSITTYANYGDNMKLLDREHDWVVADEAHNLMASKDADVTLSLEMTRAITKHPESAYTRAKILHNELYTEIQNLRAREDELLRLRDEGRAPIGSAEMLTKIGEKLRPLHKEFDKAVQEQKEIVRSVKPEDRPRLIAVSATPFAWEKNVQWAEGYLFNYDAMERTGAYNEPNPYQRYMMTHFGWQMKTGKLNEPDAKVNRSLMQIQWNTHMRKSGAMSTRMLMVDKDYDRRFVLVDGGIGSRIDAALEWLRKAKDGRYSRYHKYADSKFDFLTKSRLLEAIKAKAAVDIIKEHHALGRKVVVFHDFNEGGGFAPFTFPGNPEQEINITLGWGASQTKVSYTHGEFLADFAREFPDLVGDDLGKLKSPIETLREAFPNVLFNNGLEKKKNALQAIKDFNNDEKPEANLLVVQSAKNAGWSGHDKTGKFQRVEINLGLPTAPVKSIQLEGRIYRTGQMSDAIFRYLNTGTNFERFAFASAIATRSETAENLAMGVDARGLKRSFIDAFNESGEYPASAEDGHGGKEQDRSTTTLTPFKKAISYYYGRQKKNSKTKAQEGHDYFATPEPLGLKMVEWLEPKAGQDYMEPSAGHGAIARWFPDDVNVKAIEPSGKLAADLTLNMFDPSSVINESFEAHHIGNKYDGIAMNPPFNYPNGTGGKLAMDHIAKAFGHLKEGGRLIAIVPAGPAMDKHILNWLTGVTTGARGITKLNNPDARFTAMLDLPGSTFGRAGTGVLTRVIVIDRIKGGNTGKMDPMEQVFLTRDAWEGDVNALFDAIEHVQMPPRPKVAAAAEAPASVDGVTMHAHGRVVDDASKATFKVVGDKLETDAPIEKVTTAAGKELEGVFVPDRETAKAVDQFTWKPKGKDGFFVRIRHVIRPKADPAFSMGGRAIPAAQQMSVAHLTAVVEKYTKGFGHKIPVHILDDASTLHLIEPVDPADGFPKGVTVNGKIYLFRNAIEGVADARETLFHEMLHYGVRRFLTEQQYVAAMMELYRNDKDIRTSADFFAKGAQAAGMRKSGKSEDYILARGVDEALADLADRVMNNDSGFRNNSLKDKIRRALRRIAATLADILGFKELADKYRSATNDQARYMVKHVFAKLARGDAANKAFANGYWSDPAYRRESERTVNLSPAVKEKNGLLETPLRLAFQKTGALGVWRSAFRVLEKTGSMALDNKLGEIVKTGMTDRYGLSDAVIERHEEMRVQMFAGQRASQRFLDRLQGLTRAQYAVLYAAANNADADAVNDMIKALPEDAQEVLHEIKALVRDLGKEAVDLNMLEFDTFKANEMAYLHRSYKKYETGLEGFEKSNRATRIKGDQFKQRGLADVVSSDRLMKWMPEFWGTRVKNGAVTNGSVGQVFVRLERREDPRSTPNLEGIEGEKALGRLREVVYWPLGEEIPAKFGDWHVEGEWTIRRTHGKNVVFRRDFTQEERRKMGEIEDIRYAMAKTINMAVHDVEVGKYFAWLAEGHAKLPGDLPRGAEVIEEPLSAMSRFQGFGKDAWVRVPDMKIKDTNVSAYGKLAGRYVPGPVWTDIRHVANGQFYTSQFGRSYEKLLRLWKLSKTALSPAVHVNNVMANIIMADWHEVDASHILQAAIAFASQGKAASKPLAWAKSGQSDKLVNHWPASYKRLIEDFQDNGGELGTYALNEMQREQLAPILEELLGEVRKAQNLNGIVNAATAMSLLREGMARGAANRLELAGQAAAAVGHSKVGQWAGALPGKMIEVYQLEDQIFRLAAFIKARESGLTDREAGRFARKSFLDYDISAPWVVAAKRSGLLPFVAFSYRAIPMLYTTLRDKPWKLMKLAILLGGVNAASAALLGLSDDDEEDERRFLPKEKSGKVWGMIPKMVRMPWNTASDNPVFLDIRRFIPAGDIVDLGGSQSAVPLPPFLTVGGPLALMTEILADKSLFTGKELNKLSDTKMEAAVKVLDHVYKWAAPNVPLPTLGTVVPGVDSGQFQTYAWTGIVKAAKRQEGTFGRDQNVPMAIGSAFGVKLEGYSKANGLGNMKAQQGELQKQLRLERSSLAKQRVGGGLSDVEYVEKVRENQAKAVEAQKDYAKRLTK